MDDRMSLYECERLARDGGYNSATFDLCGANGRLPCKWLDAYMGLFTIDGQDGFAMTRDFPSHLVWCENLVTPHSPAHPESSADRG